MQPKKVGIAPFVQVTVGAMIFFYALNYGKMSKCLNCHSGLGALLMKYFDF